MSQPQPFTTPVGRFVAGSLTEPNTKDAEGRPLTIKSGADQGKPRVDYYVAIAIAKGPEAAHGPNGWMQTEWGQKIAQAGIGFLPHAVQMPSFAWKVLDGDSQIPNKKGKRPCDQTGYAGHWVLRFSSGFAPTCYSLVGLTSPAEVEAKAINLGDYIQISGTVGGNGSPQQPGVYLNHRMICLIGYGQRIFIGPDVAAAGFGGQPLPAGASLTPPGGFTPPQAPGAVPVPQAIPPVPSQVAVPPAIAPQPAALPTPPVPVVPNPAVLHPPTAPARVMLPAANGATYEQFLQAGWTDQQMIQAGILAA